MNKIKLRKTKKYLSENKFRIVIISIILFSFFLITGYALNYTILGVDGVSVIEQDENTCDINIVGEFKFDSSWENNQTGKNVYSYTLIVENMDSEPIVGWTLVLKGPNDLNINWVNANVTTRDDGALIFTPLDWNSQIASGDKLNLSMALETVEEELNLQDILFNNCRIKLKNSSSDDPDDDESTELVEIVLTPLQQTMEIGEELLMKAVKNPTNATGQLTWSSSNENVATVSNNGLVTAISSGTTQITVSSGDISTTSTITVEEKEINNPNTDEQLSFTFSSPYYYVEGRQIQFKIVVKNNTNTAYKKFSFDTNIPANSTYDLWQNPGVTISGSTITFDILWGNVLPANGTIEFTGNITLPEGYNVTDYLNPTFSNINIIE